MMKILNTSGEEIINPDLSQGYLEESVHTFLIPAVPAQTHNWISGIYFSDGSAYYPKEDDPNNHIEIIDAENKKFKYNNPEDTRVISGTLISEIIDVPEQSQQEITEKVLIYRPYTELELTNQETINDILLLIADLVGGGEEPIEELPSNDSSEEHTEETPVEPVEESVQEETPINEEEIVE